MSLCERRPSSSSTFSNDFSSEATRPNRFIFHIHIASTDGGNEYLCILFRSDKNSGCYGNLKFPLTCMKKSGNWHFPLSGWGYLNLVFT